MKQLMHDRLQTKEMSIDLLREKNKELKRTLTAQSERFRVLEERVERAATSDVINVYQKKLESTQTLAVPPKPLQNAAPGLDCMAPQRPNQRSLDSPGAECKADCRISSC